MARQVMGSEGRSHYSGFATSVVQELEGSSKFLQSAYIVLAYEIVSSDILRFPQHPRRLSFVLISVLFVAGL
jgi:hypothetical protein